MKDSFALVITVFIFGFVFSFVFYIAHLVISGLAGLLDSHDLRVILQIVIWAVIVWPLFSFATWLGALVYILVENLFK